jgi:hypothetical protein
MQIKRSTIALLIILALSCSFAYALESSSSEYVFVSELFPSEGPLELNAATNLLQIHQEPSKSSPIVEQYRVKKGEKISFDKIQYCTVKPAIVKTINATHLNDVIIFGKLNYLSVKTLSDGGLRVVPKIDVKAGEVFEYMQDGSEGSCVFRWHGVVYEGSCSWKSGASNYSDDFKVSGVPLIHLWVRITKNKKPVGWFLVEKKLVTGSDVS